MGTTQTRPWATKTYFPDEEVSRILLTGAATATTTTSTS